MWPDSTLALLALLACLLASPLAWAGLRFDPAQPNTRSDIYAITSASGGYTNVAVTWSGPRSGSAGCAPGRPCGARSGGTYTWHHRIGTLPAGTYQVVFKSDQCNPCDKATLVVAPPCSPKAEVCNNKDDDCDGNIDDGLERPCYTGPKGTAGQGPCKQGKQICIGGKWATCLGEVLPQSEECNNKDDDCDGKVDNGCDCKQGEQRECYSGPAAAAGKGICTKGTQVCRNGAWMPCTGDVKPADKDTCGDGKDNNCDGTVDDGCGECTDGATKICYTGPQDTANVGSCKPGQQTCVGGVWGSCQGEVVPAGKDTCGDGIDNDCDGRLDQGCSAPEARAGEPVLQIDAGGNPTDAPPIACPNGRIVWSCPNGGKCQQVCRKSRGCGCQGNGAPAFLGAWLLLLLWRLQS